jgi:uncharacterized membrane protein YhaH (DUF805 family)
MNRDENRASEIAQKLSLLFGLRLPVSRAPYIRWGLALALLKFGIDTAVVYAFTAKTWSPLGYLVPSLVLRATALGQAPEAMQLVLPLLALPFLWIGLSMSVRRAADAGLSPWWGTLFLVPLANYLIIAYLCLVPSRPGGWRPASHADAPIPPGSRTALASVFASVTIGVAMTWLCVYGLGSYGLALFFVTPFAMGASSAAVYNREHTRSVGSTLIIAIGGVLLTGSALLLFGIEGIVCLAMAMPIAILIATLGALVGRAVVTGDPEGRVGTSAFMLMVAPSFAFAESRLAVPTPREVTTAIEIDAPPEAVWPHVLGFTDLDEPPDWFFRLGIAYPKRARITGSGVGAVRHCEFSTGSFVEPITDWSPPRRLAFDVVAQPPSMTEWSPYGAIRSPHLQGYMSSTGGAFALVGLPGGRTRLEGTTHYTLAIYPELYWAPYAEALVHAIHLRVLRHIKKLSEASDGPLAPGRFPAQD